MEQYKCVTHGVILIIDAKEWTFQNPQGSYAGMPKCHLHLTFDPKEEKISDCEIVKEED